MKFLFVLLIMTLNLFSGCSPKVYVPSEDMHQIKITTKNLTLKVDGKVYYQASIHGSVGSTVEVHIDNEGVVKVVDEKIDYKNPDSNMSGADAATKTFILQALQPGEAKITIKDLFRGEVRSEQVVDCIVSK